MTKRPIEFRLRDERNKIVGFEKWSKGDFNNEGTKDYYFNSPKWLYSKDGVNFSHYNNEKIDHRYKDEYTGLTDKNGKKIFEGDILKHPGINSADLVFWSDMFGAWIAGNTYLHIFCGLSEIIGNEWENPELMEGVKNETG